MNANKPSNQIRGRLWIAVGLSLAALGMILFGVIVAAQSGRYSRSPLPPPSTSVPPQVDRRITIVPPELSPSKDVSVSTQITVPPVLGSPDTPITVTAPPPQSTVTVTVQAPTPTSAPQSTAAQPNSSASPPVADKYAWIGPTTALVVAVAGLTTAATGLVRALRSRGSTGDAAA
jgi:hypothetical protein